MERPPSVDEDLITEWSLWVLDRGLPALPETVVVGQTVPVARWAGPRFGAVLHLQWSWGHEDVEDDYLATEIEVFRRVDDQWEAADGSGGSDWPSGLGLRRPAVPPPSVALDGVFDYRGPDWSCSAYHGLAGVAAASVEVVDAGGSCRLALDSPLGIVLAAVDPTAPAVIRVLDRRGALLASRVCPPEPWTGGDGPGVP